MATSIHSFNEKEDFRTAESMLDFDMTYSITDMGTFDFLVELIVGEEGLKHLKALKKYDAEDLDYMVTSVVWDLLKFALNESSFSFIDIENKFNTIFSKLFSSLFPSSDPTSFWEPFCKYIDVQLDDIPEKFHEELVGLFIENAGDEDSSSYALVSSAALDFYNLIKTFNTNYLSILIDNDKATIKGVIFSDD